MLSVLLVEEGWTATVHVARALEARGCSVTVATTGGTRPPYLRRSVRWLSAPPLASPALLAFLDRLAPRFDRVVPLTESTMWRLWDAAPPWRDRIFPHLDATQVRMLRDKHVLIDELASRGIPVPARRPLDRASELGIPVVLKGATGAAGTRVRIVDSPHSLADAIARARSLGGAWIAQEHLPSPTYLVAGVFHAGEPVRLYAAEKLEQYPPRTGPAIRLRSADHAALIDLGVRAVREVAWTGFASVDLMRRADGSHVVLEINPRPWSSIAGAAEAGVDLFTPIVELLADRSPAPDLAFAADRDSLIFPRYLLAQRYRSARGLARAVRDLFGERGRDWRNPGFTLHYLTRFYAGRDQWK